MPAGLSQYRVVASDGTWCTGEKYDPWFFLRGEWVRLRDVDDWVEAVVARLSKTSVARLRPADGIDETDPDIQAALENARLNARAPTPKRGPTTDFFRQASSIVAWREAWPNVGASIAERVAFYRLLMRDPDVWFSELRRRATGEAAESSHFDFLAHVADPPSNAAEGSSGDCGCTS